MEISVLILDEIGNGILSAGSNFALKIRRSADGYWYDWNDGGFKNSNWTSLNQTMAEVSAINAPGVYTVSIDSALWNNGSYSWLYVCSLSPSVVLSDMDSFFVENGVETDDLITAIKAKTDNLPNSPAAVGSAMTLTSAYDAAKTAAADGHGLTQTEHDALLLLRDIEEGDWILDQGSNQMIILKKDHSTVILRFDLKDRLGHPSTEAVYSRRTNP